MVIRVRQYNSWVICVMPYGIAGGTPTSLAFVAPITSIHVGTWASRPRHRSIIGTPTSLASPRLYRAKKGYIKLNTPTSERFLNIYFIFTFLLLQAVCRRISRVNKDCFYFTIFHSSEKQKISILSNSMKTQKQPINSFKIKGELLGCKRATFRR